MAVTRKERVAAMKPLLKQKLSVNTIAAELGISRSYAFSLRYDPSGTRERKRKRSYGGRCKTCGRRTDGSNGKRNAPSYCKFHAPAHKVQRPPRWPEERIIDAIQRWNHLYGRPPTSMQWNATQLRYLGRYEEADLFRAGGWPWFTVVIRCFGKWGAALEAAGFAPHRAYEKESKSSRAKPGVLEKRLAFVQEMMEEGVPRHFVMRRVWKRWGYKNISSLGSTLTQGGVPADPGWAYRPYRQMTEEEWKRAQELA